ncbi:MAG: hypothetical protein FJ333_03105 [Sphingomonadales bacterium]|nr:hypothetical protein [Sphingomonadales bacterium]
MQNKLSATAADEDAGAMGTFGVSGAGMSTISKNTGIGYRKLLDIDIEGSVSKPLLSKRKKNIFG